MVELLSSSPGAGKTQLLYYAIAAVVLPQSSYTNGQPNTSGTAVLLDTDNLLCVSRLAQVMRHYLTQHAYSASKPIEKIITDALQHVHIMQPQSLTSLVQTISSLPVYLSDPTRHHSSSRSLDLVVLDSVTAFYWQERWADDAGTFTPDSASQTLLESSEERSSYAALVDALRGLQLRFGARIVATAWGAAPSGMEQRTGRAPLRSPLPSVWQGFVTRRVGVMREVVRKFPEGMGLQQAMREAEARRVAVEGSGFRCWVDGLVGGSEVRLMIDDEGVRGEE